MSSTRMVLPEREAAAAASLASAFAEDPVMHWLFPDESLRPASLSAFMAMVTKRSTSIGHAFELSGGGGAAVWSPPGVPFFTEEMGLELFQMVAAVHGEERALMMLAGFEPSAGMHPAEPHFYLSCIGVEQAHRGTGQGRVLLDRVLAVCDAEGIPAHLESSNPRNISLYERAGFEVVAEVELPEGPVLRPMTRRAG